MTIPLMFDAIILGTLIVFLVRGAKRGGILTLFSLTAVVLALVGSGLLTHFFTPPAASFLAPRLTGFIQAEVERRTNGSVVDEIISACLDQGLDAMKAQGGSFQEAAEKIETALLDKTAALAASTLEELSLQVSTYVCRCLLFMIFFGAVLLGWNALCRSLDLVSKLPVLHQCNQLVGGGLGLLFGMALIYLAVWLLCSFSGLIPPKVVEETRLLHFFQQYSPLALLNLL
jgi:hypothetical protein